MFKKIKIFVDLKGYMFDEKWHTSLFQVNIATLSWENTSISRGKHSHYSIGIMIHAKIWQYLCIFQPIYCLKK